jgi:hypothetical protein
MPQQIRKRRVPVRRARLRQTLLPYASQTALSGLQIIFLFAVFHDSTPIRIGLYLFAVLLGVWGSAPLLRSLMSRNSSIPFSPAVFQRSLPSVLLLAWGESHLLDCSYIPFNKVAVLVWLVYVTVGLFFGVVRAGHRARILRDNRRTPRCSRTETELDASTVSTAVDETDAVHLPFGRALLARPQTTAETEAAVAGRS